jgi:predicted transcriptional regulator
MIHTVALFHLLSNQLSLPPSHEEPKVEKHSLLMNCNTDYHADGKIFSMITEQGKTTPK